MFDATAQKDRSIEGPDIYSDMTMSQKKKKKKKFIFHFSVQEIGSQIIKVLDRRCSLHIFNYRVLHSGNITIVKPLILAAS